MKGQILIIDDNAMDIKIATSALERSGFASFGFLEHKKAFEWLDQNVVHLIFLDLQLPDISGYDLIEKLRGHSNGATVPIIIISGKNQLADVKKAIELGANDYVVKPLDPLILQEKVQKIGAYAEEFQSVPLPSSIKKDAFFAMELKITGVSEFGLSVVSNFRLGAGDSIEIAGLDPAFFGRDRVLVRCLRCDTLADKKTFSMTFTFIGMLESQRQILRKSCRQAYVLMKQGA